MEVESYIENYVVLLSLSCLKEILNEYIVMNKFQSFAET